MCQSGSLRDQQPFFAGTDVGVRMDQVRTAINDIRVHWDRYPEFMTDLREHLGRRDPVSGDDHKHDHEDEDEEEDRRRITALFSSRKDWADRHHAGGLPPGSGDDRDDYSAIRLYTSQPGYRRIFGSINAAFRDASLTNDTKALRSAAFLVELGRFDLSAETNDQRWVVMDERLVALYTSVLAEDVGAANRLQLTTDQPHAYAVTNGWSANRMAQALLDNPAAEPSEATGSAAPGPGGAGGPGGAESDVGRRLALLALNLVVPADLGRVPVRKIVELRRRHGQDFLSFGLAVDQAAARLSEIAGISDQELLQQYLRDEVESRFAAPLQDLRGRLKDLQLDAATMAVNVKTEIPATMALAGGAWLAGQPVVAGTTAVALGLLTVRQNTRRQRDALLRSAGPASFLLHAEGKLGERNLLSRALDHMGRIAGMQTA
ncbi:DUF6236 family protein [Streptomyces sp. YIM S03343]